MSMTNEKAIDLLRRMQEPEAYEPQITEEAFKALELAIKALGTDKNDGTTDTISRKAALNEIMGQPPELHYPSWYADQIRQLPPIQPVIIPCDYAKACNEATMNKITSAVAYYDALEELRKHGYVLVDLREATT